MGGNTPILHDASTKEAVVEAFKALKAKGSVAPEMKFVASSGFLQSLRNGTTSSLTFGVEELAWQGG